MIQNLSVCRYVTELLGGEKYVSCSVVLPALCHLKQAMKISDDDPAYIVRFKAALTKDLDQWKEKTNLDWLKVCQSDQKMTVFSMDRLSHEEIWRLDLESKFSSISN